MALVSIQLTCKKCGKQWVEEHDSDSWWFELYLPPRQCQDCAIEETNKALEAMSEDLFGRASGY